MIAEFNPTDTTNKPKKAGPKKAKADKPVASPKADAVALHRWASTGVYLTLGMSALLNGYANAQHSPVAAAGWIMGFATPALVLILSRVASLQYRKRRRNLAAFTGATCVGLLALSVWHCATAVSLLTGTHLALAVPMAIAIDCGLVACELATVSEIK
jgi:hypothetical protein